MRGAPAFLVLASAGCAMPAERPGVDPARFHAQAATTSVDADGDGWSLEEGDCDDTNSAVKPGTDEVAGDLVDDNCDGTMVVETTNLEAVAMGSFHGEVLDQFYGSCTGDGVAFLPDVTGDGNPDIAIGASGCWYGANSGRAFLLAGPMVGNQGPIDAFAQIRSTDPAGMYQGMGGAILGSLGDLDDDGWPEIGYSATFSEGHGRFDIFATPMSGLSYDVDSDVALTPALDSGNAYYFLGIGMLGLGDSLWGVTAWSASTNSANVYVYQGLHAGPDIADTAAFTLLGDTTADGAMHLAAADLDADGIADLAVGIPGHEVDGDSGLVLIVSGPIDADLVLVDAATVSWEGDGLNAHLGESIAGLGDIDGDGFEDLAAGAYNTPDGHGYASGAAYVLRGDATGAGPIADADLRIESENAADNLGDEVAGLGDLDGDGLPEAAFTATRSFALGYFPPPRVYLMRSPSPSGVISAGELDGALIGAPTGEIAAYAYGPNTLLAGGSDTDLDGVPEFLVGSPLVEWEGNPGTGEVHLIEGWPF